MGGSSKLAPPAQSSACPEGPEPRSGEGVNPMLSAVRSAGSLAKPPLENRNISRASHEPLVSTSARPASMADRAVCPPLRATCPPIRTAPGPDPQHVWL